MIAFRTIQHVLLAMAGTALLASCATDTMSSNTAPSSSAQMLRRGPGNTLLSRVPAIAGHPDRGPSHMDPNAKKDFLLYVSDAAAGTVQVYKYPSGTNVGTLTGFSEPQGLCADRQGDVFVANTEGNNIIEYAHGGTSPIATLNDPGEYPAGCAVDKKSGDLAVSNIASTTSGPGSLSIFPRATGTPKTYLDPKFQSMFYVTYNPKGTLYVDGLDASSNYAFASFHNGAFNNIPLEGVHFPGGTIAYCYWCTNCNGAPWWCSPLRVIGGDQSAPSGGSAVDAIKKGNILGTLPLEGSSDVVQFSLGKGNVLIAPDAGNGSVEFYKFPAGGPPFMTITGLEQPIGSTLSL